MTNLWKLQNRYNIWIFDTILLELEVLLLRPKIEESMADTCIYRVNF